MKIRDEIGNIPCVHEYVNKVVDMSLERFLDITRSPNPLSPENMNKIKKDHPGLVDLINTMSPLMNDESLMLYVSGMLAGIAYVSQCITTISQIAAVDYNNQINKLDKESKPKTLEYELTDAEKEFYADQVKSLGYQMPQTVLSMPHLIGSDGVPKDPEKDPEYFTMCRAVRKYCNEIIGKYINGEIEEE